MEPMDKYAVVDGAAAMRVFEIYIKTTPERLWEAITDPEMRAKYSFGVGTSSDWTPGSRYEVGHPRRGRRSPRARTSRSIRRAGWCRASPRCGAMRSRARAPRGSPGRSSRSATPAGSRSPTISSREDANDELYGGWPMILSGLKTLLETGELLDTPGSLRYSGAAG